MHEIEGKNNYITYYSEEKFWDKLKSFALKAGHKLIEKALVLFYVAIDKGTPMAAKAVIYGALGYFILPVDAIPDFIPIAGFSDDLAAIMAAYKAISANIKPEHEEKAQEKLKNWFKA